MPSKHVFPRHCKTELPTAAAGDGAYLIDANGKRYLDACGGAAVSCLGHSNRRVLDAVKDQLQKIAYAHTGFFTSEPAEQLASMLAERAPGDLDRVYFVSGGSEAVEAAIKLARQYFLDIGQGERKHVIARWQSYHGNTLGALSAGGNRWRRGQFEPLLVNAMHHIAPCHYWRWGEEGESEKEYAGRVAGELEEKILELGPDTVAAFIAEPVVGATMGAVPAVPGYFTQIREICDKYGVLLILDEVMCGMGRTGTLFASEQDAIAPDIVTIAKGLGAGIQPIGATIASSRIYDAIAEASGFFQHGHTYNGHPTACAAGVAVLSEFEERDLLTNVRGKGAAFRALLEARFGQHPNIGDIRGRGLFLGLELVEDRETKAPLDPSRRTAGRIKQAAMEAGLMCYPGSGTIDGKLGDHILLAPPFIVEDAQLGEIVDKLDQAISAVLGPAAG